MIDGVLVVDKPRGMTSHDVVDAVRSRLGTRKVGHAGTLDPDATGLLVIGVGRATRFLSYAQAAPKRYLATVCFGVTTSTQDASGEIIERRPVELSHPDLAAALDVFRGEIEQVPPMVSAVKVAGEPLYLRARRGEEIERGARRVTVHSLELVDWRPATAQATLDVSCSAGTYIRTLAHDLGARLGCGAHLCGLRRTEAGGFSLADAVALDEVAPERLRPLIDAVGAMPRVEVDQATARRVRHGRPLALGARADSREVAVVAAGELLAVYARRGDRLVPERVVGA